MKRSAVSFLTLALLLPVATGAAVAAEDYQKFLFSFAVGNFSTTDFLRTNANNVAIYRNVFGGLSRVSDPRPNSAIANEDSIHDDWRFDVQASYGLFKMKWAEVTIDSSAGYFKGKVGDLEVSAQFDIVDPPRTGQGEFSRYHVIYVPLGQVTEVPVQVGATLRFRPKPDKRIHPYLGVGAGYLFAKFDASDDFLTFSRNVANSRGTRSHPTSNGTPVVGPLKSFKAAQVDAPDSFEYYARAGVEIRYKKGVSILLGTDYMWATETLKITTDGSQSFGHQTPNGFTTVHYAAAGYPVVVSQGGFVDYGSGSPEIQPNGKVRVGPKDGIPDTGEYYVQGGELRYSGFQFSIGLRYTF